MTNSNNPPSFKQRHEGKLFWIGVVADLIAVAGFFIDVLIFAVGSLKNGQQPAPGQSSGFPSLTATSSSSDAVIFTGVVVLIFIGFTFYVSFNKSKANSDPWPSVLGVGLIFLIAVGYFRWWLGENWWLLILPSAIVISAIVTYALFKTTVFSDTYRLGCLVVTLGLVAVTFFLIVTTGVLANPLKSEKLSQGTPQYTMPMNQLPQLTESYALPTSTTAVDNNNPNGYISYKLISEGWFPTVNGLNAGNFAEATNEKSAWGNTENLKLFQEMGRITSFEKFYYHPQLCKSNNLRDAYVQIFFFQSPVGAKQFFDMANKDAKVTFIYTVGNNAYVYDDNENVPKDTCRVDYASTTFQRNNVIARARVRGVEGKMDYATLESISLQMALFIDEQLKSNAK